MTLGSRAVVRALACAALSSACLDGPLDPDGEPGLVVGQRAAAVSLDPQLQHVAWREVQSIPARWQPVVGTLGDDVLVTGGTIYAPGAVALTDTWVFRSAGGFARRVDTNGPADLVGGGAVGDVFIAYEPFGRRTWEWNGAAWRERFPAHAPSARSSPSIATVGDALLLFGGIGTGTALADTWRFDGEDWVELSPPSAPTPRGAAAMARVGTSGTTVLLYGGLITGGSYDDTWEWDGTTWTMRTPPTEPPRRTMMAMATSTTGVILYGGFVVNNFGQQQYTTRADTWLWTGTTWVQLQNATLGGRAAHAMTSTAHGTWLFGGSVGSSAGPDEGRYLFDGTRWRGFETAAPPPLAGTGTTSLASDSSLLVGGFTWAETFTLLPTTQVWVREPYRWVSGNAGGLPSARVGVSLARVSQGALQFGGRHGDTYLDETWRWSRGSLAWTQLQPATKPPPREAAGLAALGDRVVLFGGSGPGGVPLGDTWEWLGTTWQQAAPTTAPPPRRFHSMATLGDRVVVFGGSGDSGALQDTWAWDGTAWTRIVTTPSPSARSYATLVPYGDTLLLHGGLEPGGTRPLDLWQFDGASWTRRHDGAGLPTPYHSQLFATGEVLAVNSSSDAEAFSRTFVYEPPLALGETCNHDDRCISGHCARGVCCDAACDGGCERCDLAGRVGSCQVATAGDPCRTASGGCDAVEVCDGVASVCPIDALMTAGEPCRPASCVGGLITQAAFCAGGTAACPARESVDCAPFGCVGTTCLTSCSTHADCATGHYCDAGTCVPAEDNGVSCAEDATCTAGHCVDGVCCDLRCDGQCEACDVGGSVGTCTAVLGAPHGARPACLAGAPCGGQCDGVERASCAYPGSDVVCAGPSCTGDVAVPLTTCDGSGACPDRATSCAPYACAASACLTGCVSNADCTGGAVCVLGACQGPSANGASCAAAGECASGFCVDGVCCDTACGGSCESCGAGGVCSAETPCGEPGTDGGPAGTDANGAPQGEDAGPTTPITDDDTGETPDAGCSCAIAADEPVGLLWLALLAMRIRRRPR